ncbi:hypothetical protein RJ639_008550, partial [Escallonia herrerae]
GTRHPVDRSGLSTSRKLVSNVLREDCALELPEVSNLKFPKDSSRDYPHSCKRKVYFDGVPTISSEERRATLREFYAVMYPSLKQLEGYLIELVEDDYRNMKFSNEDLPSEDDCGICMETCPKMVLPDCGHSMCLRCFHDWNARSQSCPFCRGSLKRVTSRDLWDLVSKHDVVNMVSLAKENLRSFYLYIETLPLTISPNAHLLLYDYLI